jgi:hypothetical protein
MLTGTSDYICLRVPSFPSACPPVLRANLPRSHSVSSGQTEISDGVEVSDELSVCSDSSYDTYANANSTATPVGPRNAGSRAKTVTEQSGH